MDRETSYDFYKSVYISFQSALQGVAIAPVNAAARPGGSLIRRRLESFASYRDLLSPYGFEVLTAPEGQDAISLLQARSDDAELKPAVDSGEALPRGGAA